MAATPWVPRIKLQQMPTAHGLPLPSYATAGSAGMDLHAACDALIEPGTRILIPTGLKIEIPRGFEAQIRPRSGLAMNTGITVLNAPGTIDSDYRGEIGVLLVHLGRAPHAVTRGDRIAQMVIAPVSIAEVELVPELSDTERGAGGFGSTKGF